MVQKYSLQDKNPVVMGLLVASHIGKLIWIVLLSTLAAGFLFTSIVLIKLATNMKNKIKPKESIKLSKNEMFLMISSFILFTLKSGVGIALVITIILAVFFYKLLKKKPEHKIYAQVLAIIFTIIIVVSPFASEVKPDKEIGENKAEIVSGKSLSHQYITEEDSFERSIELKVIEVIETDTNINKISISENELYIEYQAKDNLNNKLTKIGIYKNMISITEKLSKISSDKFDSILYSAQLDLVDKHGNTSNQRVSLVTIKKATWEKINYDNFISSELEIVADTFYLHPALK